MNDIRSAEQLHHLLDEVDHAYRELRGTLDRAALVSHGDVWKEFYRDQALFMRNQRQLLHELMLRWGRKLRPCACVEIGHELNEARYILISKEHRAQIEMRVGGVLVELRALVIQRLEVAAEIAVSIGPSLLAAGLQRLLNVELDQQRSLQGLEQQST